MNDLPASDRNDQSLQSRQAAEKLAISEAKARAFKARREALHTAVVKLEGDLAELESQKSDPDRRAFQEAIDRLSDAVEEHIRQADAPDGLLGQILKDAPWFASRVESLRTEHATLLTRAHSLSQRAESGEAVPILLRDARALSSEVSAHRHRGTDLLLDAYMLDIPAGD